MIDVTIVTIVTINVTILMINVTRNREVFIYDGDLKDEEAVLEFLTDDDNFSMGDKIEDVDAESLISIIETDPYVSVFFYDDTKESSKALEHMEDIDDETDVFNIRLCSISIPIPISISISISISDSGPFV